jgi:hypothetical protein
MRVSAASCRAKIGFNDTPHGDGRFSFLAWWGRVVLNPVSGLNPVSRFLTVSFIIATLS